MCVYAVFCVLRAKNVSHKCQLSDKGGSVLGMLVVSSETGGEGDWSPTVIYSKAELLDHRQVPAHSV